MFEVVLNVILSKPNYDLLVWVNTDRRAPDQSSYLHIHWLALNRLDVVFFENILNNTPYRFIHHIELSTL